MPISPPLVPSEDDGSPRMVTLRRKGKEVSAIGAANGEDAARQAAILMLQQEGGLRVGDVIQVSRIQGKGRTLLRIERL